ncbi:acyltransferase family protein [Mucilaginibacter psychrotolerans]|uniref:Acyltransferase n=1 Tax=Mucilaginibacter psychrotolerans TaxID=1524096 RepID=A0A4Y8SKS0_9SPHI|nr:acyltransferase [Mucilaginibacter psychrotolerans]TFF39265.1 acyltransferase [Mucilaginibacter psychrotolerans]
MSKPHYPILDGLRGTAALLVVIFHLLEAKFPELPKHPMHHGYLAVDFFYLLSGFVVGYAYDDRWAKGMTVGQFFKIRLFRLHPLVILGTIVGAICFWLDPYKDMQLVNIGKFVAVILFGFTLLPATTDVRGWGETHPLDGPCWSLLQEYLANFLYAIVGRKLSKTGLWVLVIISAVVLTVVSVDHGDLGTGWGYMKIKSAFIADWFYGKGSEGYPNIWVAPVRMMFPFFAGLLLFRTGKLIRIPMAYTLCSLLLAVLFFFPYYSWNGYFDALCIIIFFPLVVAAGAGGQIAGRWATLCKFSGDISYPIYIMHYPFIYVYMFWIAKAKPEPVAVIAVAVGLFFFFILLAYAALKLYDEPVRKWLKAKFV